MGKLISPLKRMLFLGLTGIPIILVMSLHTSSIDVIYDINGYYNFYKDASVYSLSELIANSRFEIGYILLNKIFAMILPNPQFIFAIVSIICVSCAWYYIYKNSNNLLLSVLCFVTLGTMTFEYTAFRQAIAMSICLLAVEFIKKKQLVPFIAIVLLAFTFHKTALCFLPSYFLLNSKFTPQKIVYYILCAPIVVFYASYITSIGNKLFDMDFYGYIGNDFGGTVQILIFIITIVLSLIYRKQLTMPVFVNMVILGLMVYLLRYSTLAAERIAFYFTAGLIIALPNAINQITNMHIRRFVNNSVVVLSIALFAYRLSYMTLANYHFFWER